MITIVAEIGVNWKTMPRLKRMILLAKKCGADMVKLQYYRECDITNHPLKKKLLPMVWTAEKAKQIIEYGKSHDVIIFFTPENEDCVDDLEEAGNPIYKISHSNYRNGKLWSKIAYTEKKIVCSVPEKNCKPIEIVAKCCNKVILRKNVCRLMDNLMEITYLYCTHLYPTPDKKVYMPNFLITGDGFSDHTVGITAAIAAAARGARLIEVHFKVDENCIDAPVSKSPKELKEIVYHVRRIEQICKF